MIYNWILEHLALPAGDLIFGSDVMKNLRMWRKICLLNSDELKSLQRQNLHRLLAHASKNVPFYKEFAHHRDEDPYLWIKEFPIVKKEDINRHIEEMVSERLNQRDLIRVQTSGSSGVQGQVLISKKEQSINRAIQILWWEWTGWWLGKPIVQTGMTIKRGLLKSIKDLLLKTEYYNAFGLSDKDSKTLLTKRRSGKYYHLAGYASSLYVLAKIANESGLNNIRFDAAISWGDKMFDHYRKEIKSAFGCRVFDTYACSEGLMVGAQFDCEYYYILSPHVYLELVDSSGQPVQDGCLGYVIGTRLDGFSMPLIRYYTGDLAVKLPISQYPSGLKLGFPLLQKIIGRDTDIIYTQSGKYMIVHFFTGIFEFYPQIQQFQVIQRSIDAIEIDYIPSKEFRKEILAEIECRIISNLGEYISILWKQVALIEPTSSGKPQIVKSFIGEQYQKM